MKKCPGCGADTAGKIGRPMIVDDAEVRAVRARGASLAEIASSFGVSRSAIQHSLRRSKKGKLRRG